MVSSPTLHSFPSPVEDDYRRSVSSKYEAIIWFTILLHRHWTCARTDRSTMSANWTALGIQPRWSMINKLLGKISKIKRVRLNRAMRLAWREMATAALWRETERPESYPLRIMALLMCQRNAVLRCWLFPGTALFYLASTCSQWVFYFTRVGGGVPTKVTFDERRSHSFTMVSFIQHFPFFFFIIFSFVTYQHSETRGGVFWNESVCRILWLDRNTPRASDPDRDPRSIENGPYHDFHSQL